MFGSPYGFLHTEDGAFMGDEPNAASTWMPVSDHPSDKATWTFRVTVPAGRSVVANGRLVSQETRRNKSTFVWDEPDPMATYLATADIGYWILKTGTTPRGIPVTVAVDPVLLKTQPNAVDFFYDTTVEATDLWNDTFGEYPFVETGAIADNATYQGQPLGFSLETQTKPVYSAVRSESTIAHELAHQWFGDSVSRGDLAEHLAQRGLRVVRAVPLGRASRRAQRPRQLPRRLRASGRQRVLAGRRRRPAARHHVRERRVPARGDDAPGAAREDRRGTSSSPSCAPGRPITATVYGTTPEFIALAERISGQDLGAFFQTWLYTKGKPTSW